MHKLEDFENMLRIAAAENATIDILFTGKRMNPQKVQELKAAHKELLQNDPAYQDLFATYKKNFLKLNAIVTGAENKSPAVEKTSKLDRCKGWALSAFSSVALVARLPEIAIADKLERNAAQKMYVIYSTSAPAP